MGKSLLFTIIILITGLDLFSQYFEPRPDFITNCNHEDKYSFVNEPWASINGNTLRPVLDQYTVIDNGEDAQIEFSKIIERSWKLNDDEVEMYCSQLPANSDGSHPCDPIRGKIVHDEVWVRNPFFGITNRDIVLNNPDKVTYLASFLQREYGEFYVNELYPIAREILVVTIGGITYEEACKQNTMVTDRFDYNCDNFYDHERTNFEMRTRFYDNQVGYVFEQSLEVIDDVKPEIIGDFNIIGFSDKNENGHHMVFSNYTGICYDALRFQLNVLDLDSGINKIIAKVNNGRSFESVLNNRISGNERYRFDHADAEMFNFEIPFSEIDFLQPTTMDIVVEDICGNVSNPYQVSFEIVPNNQRFIELASGNLKCEDLVCADSILYRMLEVLDQLNLNPSSTYRIVEMIYDRLNNHPNLSIRSQINTLKYRFSRLPNGPEKEELQILLASLETGYDEETLHCEDFGQSVNHGFHARREVRKDHIQYYPNPVKDILHFNQEVQGLELYNPLGQQIGRYESISEIDMSSFSSGVYHIKLDGGTEEQHIKIIKN